MATTRHLSEGWTLTDGIFPPFPLAQPMDVLSALREQGLIERQPSGMQLLHQEWIRLHVFTYALKFELPEEEFEYVTLVFEHLLGSGCITVNGNICWHFHKGDADGVAIPINQHIQDGANFVEVKFDPARTESLFGIIGRVNLRTSTYVLLESVRFHGREKSIESGVSLYPCVSGKYVFKYTVSLDDDAIANFEFTERLRPKSIRLTHTLPVANPRPFDRTRPEQTGYTVRLSIERMGVGCDLALSDVALLSAGKPLTRVARISPALLRSSEIKERTLSALRELGTDAVVLDDGDADIPDVQRLFQPDFLTYGLVSLDSLEKDCVSLLTDMALLPLNKLQALAGDMSFWPSTTPLWKLLGAAPIDRDAYEQTFGINATGDTARCARLSHTLQAERLHQRAMIARVRGKIMLIDQPFDALPLPASLALMESDGEKRPAFAALKSAWANVAAFVKLPDSLAAPCQSTLELPVYLINDGASMMCTVNVCCLTEDGVVQNTYLFYGQDSGSTMVGKLSLQLPSTPAALTLRTIVMNERGEVVYSRDSLVCAHRPDEAPMGVLMIR